MAGPVPGFVQGLSHEAGIRLLAIDATEAADEVRRRHGLGPVAARMAAEGLVSGQLLSAYIKGEERVTLQVQAERPRFAITVDVEADGSCRGRFTPAEIPATEGFHGAVLVLKHDAERELYRGVSPIEGLDLEGALQGYLVRSQQAVGLVRIAATVGDDGVVTAALGLLVEKLPEQDEGLFYQLFGDLATAPLAPVLRGVDAGALWGFPIEVLARRAVQFRCHCSRERSADMLCALGTAELRELLAEQGGAEVTCNFCRDVFRFDAEALGSLIASLGTPRGAPARS